MERFFPTRRINYVSIMGLFALFVGPVATSAAEETNWLEWLLDGSKAIAEKGQNNVTPGEVGQIPIGEIDPGDVLRSVNGMLDQVRRIKTGTVGVFSPNPPIWEAPIQAEVR